MSTGVSSAAIPLGRLVTLDYTEAGNSSNAQYVKGSTSNDNHFYLVGVSAEVTPSTAGIGQQISVWEANPMVEFRAVTKFGTLQSSHVGLAKTLHRDSSLDIAYVDLSASTASDFRVLVTGLVDAQGDSGGFVTFRFLTNSYSQGSTRISSTPYLAFYR